MLRAFGPLLRTFLFSGLFLSFSNLYAYESAEKSITSYKGQTFLKAQKEHCLDKAQKVAHRMKELGYRVFDQTCLKTMFGNQYVVAVHYEYDIMNYIENMEMTLNSLEKCQQAKEQAMEGFTSISSEVINAFCREVSVSQVKLRVDYKKNNDFIRDYRHADQSFSYDQCLVKKQRLETLLKENQVKPLISKCVEVGMGSDRGSFEVHLRYSLQRLERLKTIVGEKVVNRSSCELNDRSILSNFEQQNLDALMTFCTQRGNQLYKSVLFLDEYFSKIRDFRGFAKSDIGQCEESLNDSVSKLVEAGHAPLYQYCQKDRDSFAPVIHYLEVSYI